MGCGLVHVGRGHSWSFTEVGGGGGGKLSVDTLRGVGDTKFKD